LSGVISYPRTDGSGRMARDRARIERLLVDIEQCLTVEHLEGILALIALLGWDRLPEYLRIRYLGMLAQKSREFERQHRIMREAEEVTDVLARQKLDKVMQSIDCSLLAHCPWETRRHQEPLTVQGVRARIDDARRRIEQHGYRPLFNDEEVAALAQTDAVAQARYKVRFMERKYLGDYGKGQYLGARFEGQSGQGVKYWNTSFGQIEDADTDYRLIAHKLGLDYVEGCDYVLLVIDTEQACTLCESVSVSATFEKLGEFATHELPALYPVELMDLIMNTAFQTQYRELYLKALAYWGERWRLSEFQFYSFLSTQGLEPQRLILLLERLRMHTQIGNNHYFRGDGVTENLIEGSHEKLGVVELFTFENRKVELDAYLRAGAVHII